MFTIPIVEFSHWIRVAANAYAVEPSDMSTNQNSRPQLEKLLRERIAILDGAMGTTIRSYGMKEANIRGRRFADSRRDRRC